jgi:hypothetical protein
VICNEQIGRVAKSCSIIIVIIITIVIINIIISYIIIILNIIIIAIIITISSRRHMAYHSDAVIFDAAHVLGS